uniref:ATLIG4 n=1 Tax=Arundo donax TaxID=35708 RepID=A0A0A8Y2Q5_ARUDO
MMEVDTATLEEAESLISTMLLFILINHVRIDSNFVDVAKNLLEVSNINVPVVIVSVSVNLFRKFVPGKISKIEDILGLQMKETFFLATVQDPTIVNNPSLMYGCLIFDTFFLCGYAVSNRVV